MPFSRNRYPEGQRCMQLDPSGQLAGCIRAGVRPTARTACIRCGAQRVRFDGKGGTCVNCGQMVSMRRLVVEHDGCLELGPLQWIDFSETPAEHGGR